MPIDRPKLLRDPLFQLNLVLWMLQGAAPGAAIAAVLKECGYMLYSISQKLPPAPDIRESMQSFTGSTTAPSPEVIASPIKSTDPWLMIECKGNSFGVTSTTAVQAKKFLLIGEVLHSSVGVPDPIRGHLMYIIPSEHALAMADTLSALSAELKATGATCTDFSILGIRSEDDGIYVEVFQPSALPRSLLPCLERARRVIQVDTEDDPIPLYFIPYDPSVEQEAALADLSKTILDHRLLAEAMSIIGRHVVPARIALSIEDLLKRATYDTFLLWKDTASTAQVKERCTALLRRRLGAAGLSVTSTGAQTLDFNLVSSAERERVLTKLQRERSIDQQTDIFELGP